MTEPQAPEASPTAGEGTRSAKSAWWAWAALAVLCLLAAVQVAGMLLRDRLERRQPALVSAPAEAPAPPGRAPVPAEAPPRFGPEVTEVEVGAPPGSPLSAPAVTPATPAEKPPPPAPTPAASAAPKAAVVAEAKVPSVRKAPAGTHALLVDVFLSQRYLREAEGRLGALGLPHFVKEITRAGRGFRVTATGADPGRARRVLEAAGYACREGKGGVEAFFYYRDEAAAAAAALARAGIGGSVDETAGDRPFWKLYAGPFGEDEARAAKKRLTAAGLETTLERAR